jgi:threonine aldolase
LSDDHRRARSLAEGLAGIPCLSLAYGLPRTNIVFIQLARDFPLDAPQIGQLLEKQGVKVHVTGPRSFRLVTHVWVDDSAIELALAAFRAATQVV